jgi:hypothetical protein
MENSGKIDINEAMKDPEKAALIESFMRYSEKTPFSKMFPKKHENSIRRNAIELTHQLFVENPNLPLKEVVYSVLNKFKEDFEPNTLLKTTKVIIEEWEKISVPTSIKTAKVEFV